MNKFKAGDKVRVNRRGLGRYPSGYPKGKILTVVEHIYNGPCVYNETRNGWIYDRNGIDECFDLVITKNIVGGELL